MKKYQEMVDYHISHGYWSSSNDQRYGYVLCPNPFVLDDDLARQLYWLGKGVASYLGGLKSIFNYASANRGKDRLASMLYQTCEQGASGLPLQVGSKSIPVTKVDCMVDVDGRIWIAEVDAYNPRGIPFALFLRDIYQGAQNPFVGLNQILIDEAGQKKLLWIYANRERYYLPIFKQMERILLRDNVQMSTRDADSNEGFGYASDERIMMIPWGMNKPHEATVMQPSLVDQYQKNPDTFVYPLIPWMGTKAFMGAISNASKNPLIEALMQDVVPNLDAIRSYIPESVLLGKQLQCSNNWCSKQSFVLKKNVSSGLKGVWFCDNSHAEFLQAIQLKRTSYIAQACINQKQFSIECYNKQGKVESANWYVRLTAYIGANGEVLDAEITGRKTPDVHGAPDCIMIPCVV